MSSGKKKPLLNVENIKTSKEIKIDTNKPGRNYYNNYAPKFNSTVH